jgi:CheY-like chemotaxis protein
MQNPLIKVLLIDDDPIQARVIRNLLAAAAQERFELEWVSSLAGGLERLAAGGVAVALLDLGLPDSSGAETFTRLAPQFPALPVVVSTALEDEALGLELVHAGAQDYLVKGGVSSPLLCRTLRYAIERKQAALERERLIGELKAALAQVKTLSGLIPICAGCKQIRDDQGYWTQVEGYIQQHTDAKFSHGMCPACIQKWYPELEEAGPANPTKEIP